MTPPDRNAALESAVGGLLETLGRTVWQRRDFSPCEACYCALVILLNPLRRAYEIMEAVPAAAGEMDDCAVVNAAANLGYFARDVRTAPAEMDARLLPCLFVPDGGEPLVIVRREGDAIDVYDGRTRRTRRLAPQDRDARAAGRAWIFSLFDRSRQDVSRFMRGGTGYTWFRALVGRFSGTFAQILLSGVMLNLVALAAPLYMMAVYELVISPADKRPLAGLAFGVTIAVVTEFALRRVRSNALAWLSARLDTLVGTKIFAHLTGLPPEMVERASVAAQIARIKTFESVRDLFSGAVFLSFLEIPYVVIALALIWAVAGALVFVPLLVLLGYGVLFALMRRRVK
ncbi:MAG: hypothetical protein KGQ70_05520, partial [Alphaproteobacteria bacterium]|nr:hypothetical protein [Alphaproteobacteria bacterium]